MNFIKSLFKRVVVVQDNSANVAKNRLATLIQEQRAQRSISGNIDVQSNAVRVEYKQETFPSSFINDNTPVRQKPIKVHSFSEIKGIGPVTSRKLKSMKIFDSYDLANLTDEQCLQIKKTHHIYNIVSLRAIARELNNNSNNTN